VLDELRPIEERYADLLVVIGVHSPKFAHERDPAALASAVQRYGVTHPVLDDPELVTWRQYTARAWPTLAVIDPEGYLVASMAGEGHAAGLGRLVDELAATHREKGTLRPASERSSAEEPVRLASVAEGSDAVGIAGSPNPACHLTRQDWGVPVTIEPGGATRLPLVLRRLAFA
jgi:hypothetical protein